MNDECIANWLKSIKEKYIHGGDEAIDATRRLAIDKAIERLTSNKPQKFIAHEDGTIEPIPKVVRCKDCKKRNTWECWQYFFGRMKLPDDYYCADGESNGVEQGKKDFIVTRSITDVEGKPHVETISERELIKCKDCIYYTDYQCWNVPKNEPPRPKEETFFCADGRRKGEVQE